MKLSINDLRLALLSKVQNAKVSDTTGDDKRYKSWLQKNKNKLVKIINSKKNKHAKHKKFTNISREE